MEFKSIDVLTSVGSNLIQEADNTVAKVVLTAEEIANKNSTSILIAGLSVATNIAVGLIPEEWTLANQVLEKVDVADVVEYVDRGADFVLAGSLISLGMGAKKIYSELEVIDKMTPEELKTFLKNRTESRFTKKADVEEAVVVEN
ncbi:MAG: hypothetical protein ACRCXT_15485 [Paraclostridium sp.]